jgi:hypothetical protein
MSGTLIVILLHPRSHRPTPSYKGTVSLSGIAVGVCFGFRQHQLGATANFFSQFSLYHSVCQFVSQMQPFLASLCPPFVSLNLWLAFFKVHFGVLLLLLTYAVTQFILLVVLGLILNLWGIANVVHFVTKGMSRLAIPHPMPLDNLDYPQLTNSDSDSTMTVTEEKKDKTEKKNDARFAAEYLACFFVGWALVDLIPITFQCFGFK